MVSVNYNCTFGKSQFQFNMGDLAVKGVKLKKAILKILHFLQLA